MGKSKMITPGPDAYNVPTYFPQSAEKASPHIKTATVFSVSKAATTWQEGPPSDPAQRAGGPGRYHPRMETVTPRSPSYPFGGGHAAAKGPHSPGPSLGQQDSSRFRKGPQFGFGSTPRSLNLVPGGEQPRESDLSASTEKSRLEEDKKRKMPGPGSHDPKTSLTNPSVISHSMMAPRDSPTTPRKAPPGPGAYGPMTTFGPESPRMAHPVPASPRVRFGNAARLLVPETVRKVPGPGDYKIGATTRGKAAIGDSGPKFSMPGRPEFDPTSMEAF